MTDYRGTQRAPNMGLTPVLIGLGCLICAVLAATDQVMFLGALVGVVVLSVFLVRPLVSLKVLALGLFSLDYLSSIGLVPRASTWVAELVILSLAIRFVALNAFSQKVRRTPSPNGIYFWVGLIFVLSLLSALYNWQNSVNYLLGLRSYFKFILLFYLLLKIGISSIELKKILALCWTLVALQPLIIFWQWWREGMGSRTDWYGGTMAVANGGTSVLSVVTGMICAVAVGRFVEGRQWRLLGVSLALISVLGIADAKAGFIFILVSVVSVFGHVFLANRRKGGRGKVVLAGMVLSLGLFLGIILAEQILKTDFQDLFFAQANRAYEMLTEKHSLISSLERFEEIDENSNRLKMNPGYIGRIADLQLGFGFLAQGDWEMWIGYGLGSTSVSFFEAYSGAVHRYFYDRYRLEQVFVTQLAASAVEMGIFGLLSMAGLFMAILAMNFRFYKRCTTIEDRAVALSLTGFVCLYAVGFLYHRIWIMDLPTFLFWLTTAAVVMKQFEDRQAKRGHAGLNIQKYSLEER